MNLINGLLVISHDDLEVIESCLGRALDSRNPDLAHTQIAARVEQYRIEGDPYSAKILAVALVQIEQLRHPERMTGSGVATVLH